MALNFLCKIEKRQEGINPKWKQFLRLTLLSIFSSGKERYNKQWQNKI